MIEDNAFKARIILTCGRFIVHRSLKLNPCCPILKQLGRDINCECTCYGFYFLSKEGVLCPTQTYKHLLAAPLGCTLHRSELSYIQLMAGREV
ncbi:hypothetical protein MUK42_32973 [Musa troglodytarum]|uniref:Uncharacterized protein n=1 Tax=Musa troglodytarum TaxID=320322 RepID=A0A9E7JRS1_9LILI|nr:hypothetical protein MUK42_32973 [Musa troglodytarum]